MIARWKKIIGIALIAWIPSALFLAFMRADTGGDVGGAVAFFLAIGFIFLGMPWNFAFTAILEKLAEATQNPAWVAGGDWGVLVTFLVTSMLGNLLNGLILGWILTSGSKAHKDDI